MGALLNRIATGKILVSDGAWGTFLHQRGLQTGECPELWNVTHREDVFAIARSYVDAGADMILTNSFGGSPSKLEHYGLQDRTYELNRTAAEISREAANENTLVLGSVGPTGVMLMMGMVEPETLYEGFKTQIQGLIDGGVDAICIETMSAIDEAELAVKAAREVSDRDVVCTFTFEKAAQGDFRSMMGVSPAEMLEAIRAAGAHVIGSNCGNGFAQMIDIVKAFREVDLSIPVLIHANAGRPSYVDGKTVFPENPEMMASHLAELVKAGANVIGGCCGSTPAHIRAIADKLTSLHLR